MSRALRIAVRDYLATVVTKGFLIGLILAPVMMAGGLIGVAVMQRQGQATHRRLAVIDHSGVVAEAVVEAAAARQRNAASGGRRAATLEIEVVAPEPADLARQQLRLSGDVRDGRLHAFVEVGASVLHPAAGDDASRVRYYAKNSALDEVRNWLGGVINDALRRARLREVGVDPAAITNLFSWVPIEGMSLVNRDERTGELAAPRRQNEAVAVAVPMVVTMFAMLLLMMGAVPLLQGVMEEKSQRIAEVMLGAATPWDLMLGKLLGGVAVSLTAMTVYLAGTLASLGAFAAFAAAPLSLIPWFVAFVVGGIFMFGAVAVGLGSACNDAKDAQQLQLPLMLPVMVPMFLMLPVIQEPQGALATGLSLFPPFTPLLMLLRLSAPGGVPAWQPWVGLLGVILTAAAALWLGSRVFRVGLLLQGKRPRLLDIVRWGWRG